MTAPSVTDRERLVKVLALLASPVPGERDAAAVKAAEIAQRLGGWDALLVEPACDDRVLLERAKSVEQLLTDWEHGFLRNLARAVRVRGSISPRQRELLLQIVTEAKRRREAA